MLTTLRLSLAAILVAASPGPTRAAPIAFVGAEVRTIATAVVAGGRIVYQR